MQRGRILQHVCAFMRTYKKQNACLWQCHASLQRSPAAGEFPLGAKAWRKNRLRIAAGHRPAMEEHLHRRADEMWTGAHGKFC